MTLHLAEISGQVSKGHQAVLILDGAGWHQPDPTLAELKDAIDGLDDDEVVDVIAMVWLGRGDFSADEWTEAQALARERHTDRSADYLIGIPNLGDCLEEGAAQLGFSCEEFEINRL